MDKVIGMRGDQIAKMPCFSLPSSREVDIYHIVLQIRHHKNVCSMVQTYPVVIGEVDLIVLNLLYGDQPAAVKPIEDDLKVRGSNTRQDDMMKKSRAFEMLQSSTVR